MNSLSSRTGVGYRTRLMTRDQAERFARCLRGNERFTRCLRGNERFTAVSVAESGRTGDPERRFFVSFTPSSTARRQDLLRREQRERELRGEQEAGQYLVARDPSERFFWVCNLATGATYETVPGYSCTCEDAHYRTNGTSVRCKHDAIVRLKLRAGAVEEFGAPVPCCEVPGCDRETGEVREPFAPGSPFAQDWDAPEPEFAHAATTPSEKAARVLAERSYWD